MTELPSTPSVSYNPWGDMSEAELNDMAEQVQREQIEREMGEVARLENLFRHELMHGADFR